LSSRRALFATWVSFSRRFDGGVRVGCLLSTRNQKAAASNLLSRFANDEGITGSAAKPLRA